MANFTDQQIRFISDAMDQQGLKDSALVAALKDQFNFQIDRSLLNRVSNGKSGASPLLRQHLERILHLAPGVLTGETVSTVFFADTPPKEIKDVIVDARIARDVLNGKNPPFAEVVKNSESFSASNPEEKARIRPVGASYTHFSQPSCVFYVKWQGEAERILVYRRKPIPPRQQFAQVKGWSALWAASYEFNIDRGLRFPMDIWLKAVCENDSAAATMFLEGQGCTILQLLDYKIQFPPCKSVRMKPLGVVTNNRINDEKKKMAQTQFVFLAEIELTQKPADLQSFCVLDVPLKWVSKKDEPEKVYVDDDGKLLGMDVATMKALVNGTPKETCGSATFVRNFSLL